MRRRLSQSPTVTTLGLFLVVFVLQQVVGFLTGGATVQALFALSTPVRKPTTCWRTNTTRNRPSVVTVGL